MKSKMSRNEALHFEKLHPEAPHPEAPHPENNIQAICERCGHFRHRQENMGFCHFHRVYVLTNFDCKKFLPTIE
jgi:hypothetical protein